MLTGQDKISEYWQAQIKMLDEKLIIGDFTNFLRWPFLMAAMFYNFDGRKSIFLERIQESPYWGLIKKAIKEDNFGNPIKCHLYPESSWNLINHAHSLLQLFNFIGEDKVKSINSIFEFGGGYGSFCRLMYRLGFNGEYSIYDLPSFSKLQRIFLDNIGLQGKKINLLTELPEEAFYDVDLFISIWAIDEAPAPLRTEILKKLNYKYFLMAFRNDAWSKEWFTKFIKEKPEYNWKLYDVEGYPPNSFLLGEKNERMD